MEFNISLHHSRNRLTNTAMKKILLILFLLFLILISLAGYTQLQSPVTIDGAPNYGSITPVDWDNDGDVDLLTEDGLSSTTGVTVTSEISVLLNDGSGTFTSVNLLSLSSPKDIAIGDFNNDGWQDIATMTINNAVPDASTENLEVYYGSSISSFNAPVAVYTQPAAIDDYIHFAINAIAAGDLNGDGRDDLAFVMANDLMNPIDISPNPAQAYALMSGVSGFGSEQWVGSINTENLMFGTLVYDLQIRDLNGSSLPEIIARVGENFGGDIQSFLNQGGGSFDSTPAYYFGGWDSYDIAEVDGDAGTEMVTTWGGTILTWSMDFLNAFDGLTGIPFSRDILWIDADLDGDKDVIGAAIADAGAAQMGDLVLFENLEGGNDWPQTSYTDLAGLNHVTLARADVDGDGDEDLFVLSSNQLVWIPIGASSSVVANDERSQAISIAVANSLIAPAITGNIQGATASVASLSTAITGEDVWYTFTAPTSGVSIRLTNAPFDLLVELQDASGNLVDAENVVSGVGNEFLHYGQLTAGENYYVAIRNYNGAIGSGNFDLRVIQLRESQCNYGPGPYSLCGMFKAVYTGAPQYLFHFVANSDNEEFTGTSLNGNSRIAFSQVPGMRWNETYTCMVDAIYRLANGAGQMETVPVNGSVSCPVIIAGHTVAELKVADRCPVVRMPFSTISLSAWVCGAVDFEWEFTQQSPSVGLPVAVFRNSSDRFFRIADIPNLQQNASYSVRIRPHFANGVVGLWGPARCLNVSGTGGMILEEEELYDWSEKMLIETEVQSMLYPNPSNDGSVFVYRENWVDQMVNIKVFDMQGRLVDSQQFIGQSAVHQLTMSLETGVYMVMVDVNGGQTSERLVVTQE